MHVKCKYSRNLCEDKDEWLKKLASVGKNFTDIPLFLKNILNTDIFSDLSPQKIFPHDFESQKKTP